MLELGTSRKELGVGWTGEGNVLNASVELRGVPDGTRDDTTGELVHDDLLVSAATLLVIVFGLVEFVKQFGAKGNGLRVLSLALGISMAVAFKVREMVPEWALWIELGFFGLAVGLAASGVYGFLDKRFPRVED